jgi:hypothetical protein
LIVYQGQAQLAELQPNLPRLEKIPNGTVQLGSVEIAQASFEIDTHDLESLFPPALHPTIPLLVQWACWSVADSPWGSFHLVSQRLSCRSGVRARTFHTGGFIDNEPALAGLTAHWGGCWGQADIKFKRHYDHLTLVVSLLDEDILDLRLDDPDPLQVSDLQFFATLHGAQLEQGLRLLQVDVEHHLTRAERYLPLLNAYDAAAWGEARVEPNYPVVASGGSGNLEISPVRFAGRPQELAFTGTEKIA